MLLCCMAKAIPAYPGSISRQQPDGTILSVRLHGDEYLCFTTTEDGYTVTQRADGYYCYARLSDDGQLEPTDVIARDAEQRTDAERQWLMGIGKRLMPAMSSEAAGRYQADQARRARARAAARSESPYYDYSNFRGLIILVEFNDRKFDREDYPQMVEAMVNQENYKGYGNVGSGVFTGSVRDYFHDNSNGIFTPQFDIAGPFTVNVGEEYPNKTEKAVQLMKRVADAADQDVDFSKYDLDNDGFVDMVYIIFAGYGSNYVGDGSKYIWPHASQFADPTTWNWLYKDGVRLGNYACSTEMMGTPSHGFFDGIGTICHEFSHVLGLPDLYDTDYEQSGGNSNDPGDWTIMAGASYLNNGRTPAGYTLYERYSLGFATPEVIAEEGSYELDALGESNFGYRLNTREKKVFFLIENRQQTSKWDKYLAGHGMLVFRVDSTNANVWDRNQVNCNPKHNYFVLLRAGGGNASNAKASDPFPGTKHVTTLNNITSPANLMTWNGQPSLLGFENIGEGRGRITFDIIDVNVLHSIALTEKLTLSQGLSMQMEPVRTPDYAPYTLEWFTDNPAVATIDARGVLTAREVGMASITVVANGDENLSAQCVVTVEESQLVPDVATFREQTDDVVSVLSLNDALVVFTSDSKSFVRDASGALCIDIEGLDVEAGDMLNGIILGKKTTVNNIPMLVAANAASNNSGFTVDKGHEVTPRRISIDELTDADRNDLITLTAVTLQRANNRVWIVGQDDRRIRVFNLFQIEDLPSVPKSIDGKFFDVTGIYYSNVDGGKMLDEIERLAAVEEVDAPSGISTVSVSSDALAAVYTTDGRLVARTTVGGLATLSLRHGLYVVRTAEAAWRYIR